MPTSLASSRSLVVTAITSAVMLAACSHAEGTRPLPATGQAAEPIGEVDALFVADVKEAFAAYKAWGRVDDEMRWAPFLCRMPMPGRPAMSAASDGAHAKKLYSLFAKDHASYAALNGNAALTPNGLPALGTPIGAQIVAKESFLPEVVAAAPNVAMPNATAPVEADHFHPYVKGEDGKTYRAGQLAGVYFVIEKPAGTPGTDDGFVYGTVTPTGEVTSAGRVSSCMGCHAEAKHRRLFGPAKRTF